MRKRSPPFVAFARSGFELPALALVEPWHCFDASPLQKCCPLVSRSGGASHVQLVMGWHDFGHGGIVLQRLFPRPSYDPTASRNAWVGQFKLRDPACHRSHILISIRSGSYLVGFGRLLGEQLHINAIKGAGV